MKFVFLAAILLATIIVISSCAKEEKIQPTCPQCPSPTTYSECNNDNIKSRALYRCDAGTNYSCTSYKEEKECLTSITLNDNGLEVAISPVLDETIKGIIKIEAIKIPAKTNRVQFILGPHDVTLRGGMPEEEAARLIKVDDSNPQDGWKAFIDTKKKGNGLYWLFVGSTYDGAPNDNPWSAHIQAQFIIKN